MSQYATLYENVTGGIHQISRHFTWLEAIQAGVAYRAENPGAGMLEVYAYNQSLADGQLETSHTLESNYWKKFAAAQV